MADLFEEWLAECYPNATEEEKAMIRARAEARMEEQHDEWREQQTQI